MKILVVNAGSSTHKCALFENQEKVPLWTGFLDWKRDESKVLMRYSKGNDKPIVETLDIKLGTVILKKLLETAGDLKDIQVIGHRVVHGGEKFTQPVLIDNEVKEVIKDLSKLAPLHNPANLEGILAMEKIFPKLPQIAVFDTAFHCQIPEVASIYPIPYHFKNEGIKRYGFHGISHEYCMVRAMEKNPELKNPKIITCHLGNGASLAAIHNGHSVDTSMGFTPLEGLMMGTRCGSIDPGILIYLLRDKKMDLSALDKLLNYESGIKGISGNSDMRDVISKIDAGDLRAKLAFDMFIYRLNGNIARMAAALQGLDILVFTAGIGENSNQVRLESCLALSYLGVKIDPKKNGQVDGDGEISMIDSKVRVLVIKTEEEFAIAEKCYTLMKAQPNQ